jgi:hypothetical protein
VCSRTAQHRDSPHPFYVSRTTANLVSWNPVAADRFTDFYALPAGRQNML